MHRDIFLKQVPDKSYLATVGLSTKKPDDLGVRLKSVAGSSGWYDKVKNLKACHA